MAARSGANGNGDVGGLTVGVALHFSQVLNFCPVI